MKIINNNLSKLQNSYLV